MYKCKNLSYWEKPMRRRESIMKILGITGGAVLGVGLTPISSEAEVFPRPVPDNWIGKALCESPVGDPNPELDKEKDKPCIYLNKDGRAITFHPQFKYDMPSSLENGTFEISVYDKGSQRSYYFGIIDIDQDGKTDAVRTASWIFNKKGSPTKRTTYYRGQLHQDEMGQINDYLSQVCIPPISPRQIPDSEIGLMEWRLTHQGKISPNYYSLEGKRILGKSRNFFTLADQIIEQLPERFSKERFFSPKDCNKTIDTRNLSTLVTEFVKNERRFW